MNIKDFYKNTKKDIDNATKTFEFKKKEIKKMIENAKKNGEDINNICDDISERIRDYNTGVESFDMDYLSNKIIEIKNIVGGK